MSSRKRHLLAFLLAIVLSVLFVVGGILFFTNQSTRSAPTSLKKLPVTLSEFKTPLPSPPAKNRPKTVKPQAKAASKATPKPTPPAKTAPVKSAPPHVSKPKPVKKTVKPQPRPHPVKTVKHTAPHNKVQHTARPKPISPETAKNQQAPHPPIHTSPQPRPTPKQAPAPIPQTRTPNPQPQPAMDLLRIRQTYLNQLRQTIAQLAQDTYPMRARRRGQQGEVVLHFTLLPDGRIENLAVQNSSGFYLLDEAAKAVIEEEMNNHFRPFPPELPKTPMTITLPIRYRLQ